MPAPASRRTNARRLVRLAAALALLVCLAPAAGAEESGAPEDCRWLPDLRCDREAGRWEGFHKPIVAPFLFEDPFVVTGAYPYYVYHEFPGSSALGDGSVHIAAVQLRIALTERLGFVATKDGYAWLRPDRSLAGSDDILGDREGFLNLGFGLKYLLHEDRDAGFLVSGVLRYEAPSGAGDVLHGEGDGLVLPSLAAAWDAGPVRLVGDLGANVPLDQGEQGNSLFYHLYAETELAEAASPFLQLSGIHYLTSGDGELAVETDLGALPLSTAQSALGTGPFEGADYAVLGSEGVDNQDLVTLAAGVHVPLAEHVTLSAAYEYPLSERKGIFRQRVTTSLAIEF